LFTPETVTNAAAGVPCQTHGAVAEVRRRSNQALHQNYVGGLAVNFSGCDPTKTTVLAAEGRTLTDVIASAWASS
jgi:hypothetical protein